MDVEGSGLGVNLKVTKGPLRATGVGFRGQGLSYRDVGESGLTQGCKGPAEPVTQKNGWVVST